MKIKIQVKPNSKTEEVSQKGEILTVKVKEPPKEGKANQAVVKLLARHFGVPRSQVRIVSSFKNRNKVIEIDSDKIHLDKNKEKLPGF
ncbi:MAG: DUF167 domain-containing protein [Dehalococcoidia bacterium]|nr:DUF167 domain-containing protein [Dehalococcoidia bacterium]